MEYPQKAHNEMLLNKIRALSSRQIEQRADRAMDGNPSQRFKSFEEFTWLRHKPQVVLLYGCLAALLATALGHEVAQLDQHPSELHFIRLLLWVVTVSIALWLLYILASHYDVGRAACNSVSPPLLLTAFFAWYWPQLMTSRDSLAPVDPFLVGLLPLLVSSAPIMSFAMSCFVSATILVCLVWVSRSSVILLAIVFVLLTGVLSYYNTLAEQQLFQSLCSSSGSLKQLRKELEQCEHDSSDKISKMRQFISYIFHEIRVPFNAVVLGIGHLLAANLGEEQEEMLKMMDSSSSSMIRILNDVLDMGKIESGKLQLEKQPFNFGELISSLIWAFKETLESKGLDFSLCMDDSTKEFLLLNNLIGDKHRIRQVVANYISNAAKFTARGGRVTLRIVWSRNMPTEAAEHVPGDSKPLANIANVTVSVEDTGIGISKEDQARLFEPYMQIQPGESLSQAHAGTGLGLSFAKRIVELAGGQIGAFSEPGKGSVFSFTVPFEVVPAECKMTDFVNPFNLPAEKQASMAIGSSTDLPRRKPVNNPKVLVVEDNQTNRKILRKLLASFHVDSDDVENGKEAVERCRKGESYDMILIDKDMPVMDGHEATREIRAMGIKTTIVGLTGNALDSDRNQFLAAGVNDFFTKPLSRHQLLRLLEVHGLVVATA